MPNPRPGTMHAAELSSLSAEVHRIPNRPTDIVSAAVSLMFEHALGGALAGHSYLAEDDVVTLVVIPNLEWRHAVLDVWREQLRNNERPLEGCRRRDWIDAGTFTMFMPGDTPQSLDMPEALEFFSHAVGNGQHCLAITPDVAWLPTQLIALADHTVTLCDLTRPICRNS